MTVSIVHSIFFLLLFSEITEKFPFVFAQSYSTENLQEQLEKPGWILDPVHYDINIDPIIFTTESGNSSFGENLDNCVVTAWTKIRIRIKKAWREDTDASPVISLNPRGCKIDLENVKITHLETENSLVILNQSFHERNISEFSTTTDYNIYLDNSSYISSNDHIELYIPYTLELSRNYYEDSWQGLYFYSASPEINDSRIYEYYPLHAQFIFPAFDSDPLQRSTFKLSVARPDINDFVALSNTDVQETISVNGKENWVIDHFKESPPIPLNQVAVMILSGFAKHSVYDSLQDNIRVLNLWTFREFEDRNEFSKGSEEHALHEIQKLVRFFENKFHGTEYPLNKLDFVAVPWYVGVPAGSSNLGIIVNFETDVILDEQNFSPWIYAQLSSKIAFQWIGGIVTAPVIHPDNRESFSTWFDHVLGLLNYVSSWEVSEENRSYSLATDYSDPILFNFESLLLKMFEGAFTRKIMESAFADFYLRTMKWKAAVPSDFYNALQQAIIFHNSTHLLPQIANKSISMNNVCKTWMQRKFYYPRIYISDARNDSKNMISIYQKDVAKNAGPDYLSISQLWWVPVKILTQSGFEQVLWLPPTNETLEWSTETGKWLIINPDATGYYSVQYDANLLNDIITQLNSNHTAIPWKARNYLIHNQFTLVEGRDRDEWENLRGALEMTRYLGNETNVKVWKTALDHIELLQRRFRKPAHENEFKLFQEHFGSMMNSVLENIGITPKMGEDKCMALLRSKLIRNCDSFEIPLCMKYAVELMTEWKMKPEVDPFTSINISDHSFYLREHLYCAAVLSESKDNGNSSRHEIFYFLLDQLVNINNGSVWKNGDTIARGLSCSQNESILMDLLNNSTNLGSQYLNKETIPFEILKSRPFTMTQAVVDFWMKDLLEGGTSPASFMRFMWSLIPGAVTTPVMVDKVIKFLDENDDLFTDDLVQLVKDFKVSFKINENDKARDTLWESSGSKIIEWLMENSSG